MSQRVCNSCSSSFNSDNSTLCLKCMMSGIIHRQEAEEYKSEVNRLAAKAKKAAYVKLRENNPDFDKQRTAAIVNNGKSSKPFPTDPKFRFNTVRAIDVINAAKSPRIVRPPPQKRHSKSHCFLCGAKVDDLRQHKHDVHGEQLMVASPARDIKESLWHTFYEGGAPGLGKRHS